MTTPLPPQEPEKLPREAELAALYRKLPHAEPGPSLDQAVLRAAAQALADEAAPTPVASPRRRPRWPVALGSAAALVLVAGLAWHMREMPASEPPAGQATTDVADKPAQPVPAMEPPRSPLAPPKAVSLPARKVAALPSHAQARKATTRFAARQQVMPPSAAPMPAPPAVMEASAPAPTLAMPAPAPPATMAADFAAENRTAELEAIRQLFARGKDKEGSEQLARFHKANPGFPLPDDLRTHLAKP